MPYCTACGGQNAEGAKFCSSCGTALVAAQEPLTEASGWDTPSVEAPVSVPRAPTQRPAVPPPTRAEKRGNAAAQRARRRAERPWYRRKRFLVPTGVVAIIIIAVIATSGGDPNDPTTGQGETTNNQAPDEEQLFPGRIDAQREDQERQIGQNANIGDYQATVASAGFQQSVSDFEEAGYLVADVAVRNTGDEARPYNTFDWKLQLPSGQVLDPSFSGAEQLGSGDLVSGGSVSGQVIFEVKDQKGDFYIIYKPDSFDAARGVWKSTI